MKHTTLAGRSTERVNENAPSGLPRRVHRSCSPVARDLTHQNARKVKGEEKEECIPVELDIEAKPEKSLKGYTADMA